MSRPEVSKPQPLAVPLLIAVVATGIEALGLASSAIGLSVYKLAGHRPFDSGDLWAVVGMAAIGAIGLGLVARGLGHRPPMVEVADRIDATDRASDRGDHDRAR